MTHVKWQPDGQGCLTPLAQVADLRQADFPQAHPSSSSLNQSRRSAGAIKSSRMLIWALRQAYQQKRCAARIYRALADRERDKVRQRLLPFPTRETLRRLPFSLADVALFLGVLVLLIQTILSTVPPLDLGRAPAGCVRCC